MYIRDCGELFKVEISAYAKGIIHFKQSSSIIKFGNKVKAKEVVKVKKEIPPSNLKSPWISPSLIFCLFGKCFTFDSISPSTFNQRKSSKLQINANVMRIPENLSILL